MLIVSNNIIDEIKGADMTARINLAWVPDVATAKKLLDKSNYRVYLDYPSGRMKPPVPIIGIAEAIELSKHEKVLYFAASNIETAIECNAMMELLDDVEFIPKIETEVGVRNLKEIIATGVKTIMLDKEDLFSDVGCNSDFFNELVEEVRSYDSIKILELQGVIFK